MNDIKNKTEHSQNGHKPPLLDALSKTTPRGSEQHYRELEAHLLMLLDSQQEDDEMIQTTIAVPRPVHRNASMPFTMVAALLAVFFGVGMLMFLRQMPDNDTGANIILTGTAEATPTPVIFREPAVTGSPIPSAQDLQPTVVPPLPTTPTPAPMFMYPTATPVMAAPIIPVVISVMDLPANHELGSISSVRSIRTVFYPVDMVPPGAYADEFEVIGKFSTRPISAYRPITLDDTSVTRLSSEQISGMAVILPVVRLNGESQRELETGDKVDLMVEFSGGENEPNTYQTIAYEAQVSSVTTDEVTLVVQENEAAVLQWVLATPLNIQYQIKD